MSAPSLPEPYPAEPSATTPLAVVTGASSGIGLELAKQFAEEGYQVLIVAEDEEILAAAQLLRSEGAKVEELRLDLTTPQAADILFQHIQRYPSLDALALNAGVGLGGPFVDQDFDRIHGMILLNVLSLTHLAHLGARRMRDQGHGGLLFTSSVASQGPTPYNAVYGATKAFVQSFSQALREELSDSGVSVTSLLPGPTDTEFFERANLEDSKIGQGKKDDPALVARQALDGFKKKKANVDAGGLRSKVLAAATHVLRDPQAAKLQAPMHETDA